MVLTTECLFTYLSKFNNPAITKRIKYLILNYPHNGQQEAAEVLRINMLEILISLAGIQPSGLTQNSTNPKIDVLFFSSAD